MAFGSKEDKQKEEPEVKVVPPEEPDKTWERQRIISWLISKNYQVPVYAQDSFTVEQLLELVENYKEIEPGHPEDLPQLKTDQHEPEPEKEPEVKKEAPTTKGK